MTIESAAERAALASAWGDTAVVGNQSIPGQYEEPYGDVLGMEGTGPTFLALQSDLAAASVANGTDLDSVSTFTGRTLGPFRVVSTQPQADGAFVLLGLQQT